MAETKDTKQQEIEAEVVDLDNNPKKSASNMLIWTILIVLIATNAGLAWFGFQQKKINDHIAIKLDRLVVPEIELSEQIKALASVRERINNQFTSLANEQKELSEKLNILSDNQTLSGADVKQFWTLSEVEYLLNIANQRVVLSSDLVGAQAALMMVDDLVKGLNEPRLSPLRELIASEQLALASVIKPDVEGMAYKLRSAINAVDDLQVLMAAPVSEAEQELSVLDVNDWKGIALSAWQQIKSLVVIRNQQDGSAAVLVPEQRYFLYQNLKLKLETAQLALLSGSNSVFESSLASAVDWLNTYFVGDKRDAMLAIIAQLQTKNITVELPDISGSLTWLKGFE